MSAKCCDCGRRATRVHVWRSEAMAAPAFYYHCRKHASQREVKGPWPANPVDYWRDVDLRAAAIDARASDVQAEQES